jgi:hypothetical protein
MERAYLLSSSAVTSNTGSFNGARGMGVMVQSGQIVYGWSLGVWEFGSFVTEHNPT